MRVCGRDGEKGGKDLGMERWLGKIGDNELGIERKFGETDENRLRNENVIREKSDMDLRMQGDFIIFLCQNFLGLKKE